MHVTLRNFSALCITLLTSLIFSSMYTASASTIIYTDRTAWLQAIGATNIESFLFTAENVATSSEINSPPTPRTFLGQQLTFLSSNTGFLGDFVFSNESPVAGTEVLFGDDWLGVGTDQSHDWSVSFTSNAPLAFGIDLSVGIDAGTVFRVFDTDLIELAIFAGLPDFIGVVSDVPIGKFLYDDSPAPGGVVANLIERPVPIPSAVFLLVSGFLGLLVFGRRKA